MPSLRVRARTISSKLECLIDNIFPIFESYASYLFSRTCKHFFLCGWTNKFWKYAESPLFSKLDMYRHTNITYIHVYYTHRVLYYEQRAVDKPRVFNEVILEVNSNINNKSSTFLEYRAENNLMFNFCVTVLNAVTVQGILILLYRCNMA